MISSIRYLLDASVLSEPLRPVPNPELMERLQASGGATATAAPVWHEMVFGVRRLPPSRRRRDLEDYLEELSRSKILILAYDVAAAEWHASERARLERIGRTPPYIDGQIAAIASTNNLTLVTANVADFRHFNDLRVEDWRS